MLSTATDTEQDIATRQVILQAVYGEIHARGLRGASLAKILANTHVIRGALYHCFPAKPALDDAVADEILVEQMQQQ